MAANRAVTSLEALRSFSQVGNPDDPTILRADESLLSRAARAPAAWLTLIIGLSSVLRGGIGVRIPSPWILPDEIVYSELAKSIAAGNRPSVRGVPVFGWGEVYPTFIAPAWALFEDPVQAYHAALVINALLMSSAAVPAYLLARLFITRRASLVVSAMSVLVPSMAYTGVVMTENAFYPVFLFSVYLIARAVRRPTAGNQALALLGLGIVTFTRIQGLALVGAYAGSVFLYALTGSVRPRVYLQRFILTAAMALFLSLGPVVISASAGEGAFGWLGSRSSTFEGLHLLEIPEWFAYLAADLVLYVAVVPVVATVLVSGRGFSRDAQESVKLFAAVVVPVIVAMLGSVSLVSASLDVDGTENLNERYVFYVVPLLLLGLALWIQQGLPRRAPWAVLVVAACVLLTVMLPIDRLHYNSGFQSVALIPWIVLPVSGVALVVLAGVFTVTCGVLWLACRHDRVGRLWMLVGAWMVFVGLLTVGSNAVSAADSARHSFGGASATWIDERVAGGTNVVAVWDERKATTGGPEPVAFRLMVAEFFNSSVGEVLRVGPSTYYEGFLPTSLVHARADGLVVDRLGRPLETDYAVVPCRAPVEGEVIATGARGQLQLVRVEKPVRLARTPECPRRTP
ncbi:MAG TPA: hypothetical protein VFH69_00785 [Gemmatimonadota bacterium]|nr:hypothetical protein [Gemmatimonadota bacterium]